MSTPGSPANLKAWVPILGCTLVMTFVSGLTTSGLGVLVPEWIKGFSVSTSKVMLIMSGGAILSGFLGLTIGSLAGRFSPRALLFAGVVCGVASLVLGSLSPTFWVLLFALGPLTAAANALTGPVIGQTLAVRTFHRPGLAIASVTAGLSLSAIFAPLLLSALLKHGDWRWVMQVSAALIAVVGAFSLTLLLRNQDKPLTGGGAVAKGDTGAQTPALQIVGSPTFLGILLFQFPITGLTNGTFFHLGLYSAEIGHGVGEAARLMSLAALLSLSAKFIVGWLADRVPHLVLTSCTFALASGGAALLAYVPQMPGIAVGVGMNAFATGSTLSLVPNILARRFPVSDFRRVISFIQPVYFCSVIGALVIGIVYDNVGTYPSTYAHILPFLLISASGLLLLFLRRQGVRRAAHSAA